MDIIKLTGTDNYNLGDDLLYVSAYEILGRTEITFQVTIDSPRIRNIVQSFFGLEEATVLSNGVYSSSINVGGTLFSSKYRLRTKIGHTLGVRKIPFDEKSDIYISLGVDVNYFLRKISKNVFNQSRCVIVRDVESHIIISKSIEYYKSHILPDTVLGLKNRFATISDNVLQGDYNVFILRDWKFSGKKMREQTEWFLKNRTENDLVVFFCKTDKISISIQNKVIRYLGTYESMVEVIRVLKSSKKIYSSRYHGIVMAIALDKECEVFPIDEKLSRINDYLLSKPDDHEVYINLSDGEGIANSYARIVQEYI